MITEDPYTSHERELKDSIPTTNVGLALGANPYYYEHHFSNPFACTHMKQEGKRTLWVSQLMLVTPRTRKSNGVNL